LKIFKKSIISEECESRRGREPKKKVPRFVSLGEIRTSSQLCSELCGKPWKCQGLRTALGCQRWSAQAPLLAARGDCTRLQCVYTKARPASETETGALAIIQAVLLNGRDEFPMISRMMHYANKLLSL